MRRKRTKHLPRSIDDDRYLTWRTNKNGTVRYYWQPPGQRPVRLPDGPGMKTTLTQLNQQRDASRSDNVLLEGSVAWVIGKYKEADRYKKLSASSKRVYNPWLAEIEKLWGSLSIIAIDKQVSFKFVERYKDRPSTQKHAAVVLYNVLAEGQRHGLVPSANPAARLQLSSPRKRDAIWSAEERAAWVEAAQRHPRHAKSLVLYFTLLEYTAQRPSDVLAMTWSQYDGKRIELVQQKTGRLVRVPCHRVLRGVLDKAKQDGVVRIGGFIVAQRNGKNFGSSMRAMFQEISEAAGIEGLQARDLRRTAMVRLAEAGCTDIQIAAISGHTIDRTRQILETYVVRTEAMGEAAIELWERNEAENV